MNPEQWLSLKWNGGSTMSDRWLNQSKIIQECWFKPKKVMGDVATVHIGSGKIIVTRMDGSKWGTGIGFGNERSESEKKVGTRFVMISK